MRKYPRFPALALIMVLTAVLLVLRLVKTFAPLAVLPALNVPNMVLLSLTAVLLDHYLVAGPKGLDWPLVVISALAFGLLPLAAGFAAAEAAARLAVVGGAVFAATAWLFAQLQERLCDGASKLAPIFSALGLYLAAQGFFGMLV